MKKIVQWCDDNLEVFIGSIFLVLMVTFAATQVLGRYVLVRPFPWTEEMTRYMFVWMVYISIGFAVKENKHIRITFLRSLFSKKYQLGLDIFSNAVFLAFAAICTIEGGKLMLIIKSGGQTAISVPMIQMWLLYLVMPLGFIFLSVRLIQDTIIKIREYSNGSGDPKVESLMIKGGKES